MAKYASRSKGKKGRKGMSRGRMSTKGYFRRGGLFEQGNSLDDKVLLAVNKAAEESKVVDFNALYDSFDVDDKNRLKTLDFPPTDAHLEILKALNVIRNDRMTPEEKAEEAKLAEEAKAARLAEEAKLAEEGNSAPSEMAGGRRKSKRRKTRRRKTRR